MNVADLIGASITDSDIAWGRDAMGLPSYAFSGQDGNDPRVSVLKRLDSLDVEACPGSGKTTLLVTKLAILAKKWQPLRAGICVLSHTNVARNEIEDKLGPLPEGAALLHYPHFVGTIHSFFNEFIAIPWLKSQGIEIQAVDTEISLDRRWWNLPPGTRNYLNKQHLDKYCLSYLSHDFSEGDMSKFGSHTETHQRMVKVCKQSYEQGYFCYDEMFVWAKHALDECPTIVASLRRRFPLVFIDEVQDNSELQSALLHRVFFDGNISSIRQRFGDSNQAIFQHNESSAETDKFPASPHVDLPNSHRFGPAIAKLADPLGVRPHGLVGCGPRTSFSSTMKASNPYCRASRSISSIRLRSTS
jgi:DNA helicase-2/ATP-dependent DNA helicase PcrA